MAEISKEKYIDKLRSDIETLSSGRFFFDNPWDMESCRIPYQLVRGKVCFSPNGDPEWVYSFSRLEWLQKYIYLYSEVKDERLLRTWASHVNRFFRENNKERNAPPKYRTSLGASICSRLRRIYYKGAWRDKISTYRTLDTAIRNLSILLSLKRVPELMNIPGYDFWFRRVVEDVDYPYNNLRAFDETSNWGIIIASSYCSCKLLLGDRDIQKGLSRLEAMLEKQIYPSGAHIESSNMYHNQTLIFLLRLMYCMKKTDYDIPDFLLKKATAMAKYTISVSGPDGFQPAYGDSDYTCLFSLYAIIRKVLGIEPPCVPGDPDYILLSEFGINKIYHKEEAGVPSSHIKVHENGIAVYEREKTKLIVYNEAFRSGHKHYDNSSFVLYFNSTPVFIDSGRYSYHTSSWRDYFKSPLAHNVSMVDDFCVSTSASHDLRCISTGVVNIFCSEIRDAVNGIALFRYFVVLDSFHILIINKAICAGEHNLNTYFIPPYFYEYEEKGADVLLLKDSFPLCHICNPEGLANEIMRENVSYMYNEKCQTYKFRFSKRFFNQALSYFILSYAKGEVIIPYVKEDDAGIVIKYCNQTLYIPRNE